MQGYRTRGGEAGPISEARRCYGNGAGLLLQLLGLVNLHHSEFWDSNVSRALST